MCACRRMHMRVREPVCACASSHSSACLCVCPPLQVIARAEELKEKVGAAGEMLSPGPSPAPSPTAPAAWGGGGSGGAADSDPLSSPGVHSRSASGTLSLSAEEKGVLKQTMVVNGG